MKKINKTLILFLLSIIVIVIQGIIFNVIGTIIVTFIVIVLFKIIADKGYKNYFRDIKNFLLNDDNFVSIMIIFYFIFGIYAINNIGKENIIFTVVGYLFVAGVLFIFIDDKKNKEDKLQNSIEDFKSSLNKYAKENGLDNSEDDTILNDFGETPIKELLSKKEYKKFKKTMNKLGNEIDEALELDEDKKDNLLNDIYSKVLNKDFEKVIKFHNMNYLQKYLIETNNIEDLSEYYLLVGATYQEIGNLNLANKCFDIFLSNLSLNSNIIQAFEKESIYDIGIIKIMLLMKRLQDLGLEYKMSKEEYDKSTKPSKKKNLRNNGVR